MGVSGDKQQFRATRDLREGLTNNHITMDDGPLRSMLNRFEAVVEVLGLNWAGLTTSKSAAAVGGLGDRTPRRWHDRGLHLLSCHQQLPTEKCSRCTSSGCSPRLYEPGR